MSKAKKIALEVIRKMPDRATWDDILYEIYVRKKIERGIAAADAGELLPHADVRKRFVK